MTSTSRAQFRFAAVGIAAIIALSGCSAIGQVQDQAQSLATKAAQVQSKAAACIALQKAISGSVDKLTSSLSTISTDPAGAVTELEAMSDSFDKALSKVSNKDVAEVGEKAESSLKDMITRVKAISADPQHADTTALMTSVTNVQKAFTEVGKVCS
jgi:peptidoglycan hydrolase CwlO-like protein